MLQDRMMDTKSDLTKSNRTTGGNKSIAVHTTLRLTYGEEKVFGPGLAQLLEGILEHGSLRRSAAEMNMSYNKAWKIIKNSEAQWGQTLIERKVGGVHGGGAVLTAFGQSILKKYRAFEQQAEIALCTLVQEYFGEV